jgi:NTP pyrophosphatase (non-canonical NTP hydrolase)
MNDENTTVAQLKKLMADFVAERKWQPFHDPKNLSASIAIEAAELMEHFQWLRTDQLPSVREEAETMARIAEELADVLAYTVSFASTMGIDLSSAMEAKMKRNALKYPADRFQGRYKCD